LVEVQGRGRVRRDEKVEKGRLGDVERRARWAGKRMMRMRRRHELEGRVIFPLLNLFQCHSFFTFTNTTSPSLYFYSFSRFFFFFLLSRMNLSELDFKKVGLSKFLFFEYCLSVFFVFYVCFVSPLF
jgi:hypothetical protein